MKGFTPKTEYDQTDTVLEYSGKDIEETLKIYAQKREERGESLDSLGQISTENQFANEIIPFLDQTFLQSFKERNTPSFGVRPSRPFQFLGWLATGVQTDRNWLDATEEVHDSNIPEFVPLQQDETVSLSKKDLQDLGAIVGEALAIQGLANVNIAGHVISRDLNLNPKRGFIGKQRVRLGRESNLKLKALDTILSVIK